MAASLEEDEDFLATDYYAMLNVGKEASTEEINNAFRRLSKIYHPDKHLDQAKKKSAEDVFNKLKKAHEVLNDKHRRTIYDMYGEKGLETEGLEIISRTKSPAEIIAEYERLQREREERRLQQRTNPRGTVSIGINATDLFDVYPGPDDDDYYSPGLAGVEINNMSIFQSVECPLTVKDTVIIGGNLHVKNGTGAGAFLATWRRLTSDKGWMEVETAAGNGLGVSFKGFRQITRRCYGTSSVLLHGTERGIRPAFSGMGEAAHEVWAVSGDHVVVESVLTFSICVWFGGAIQQQKDKLECVVRTAGRIVGCKLQSLASIYSLCILRKSRKIVADLSHPGRSHFQLLPSGCRFRSLKTMLAYQFDRSCQGRITYNAGFPSSLQTALVYSYQEHNAALTLQMGLASSYLSLSYSKKFTEQDAKIKGALKLTLIGGQVECGCEKKVTQFSTLGASLVVGVPTGVHLKIRLYRGTQTFLFPIHLSENLSPSAMLYGTFVPMATYFVVKRLVIDPFLKQQKEQDLEKKKEEHAEKLAKRKQEAMAATDLMKETVERSIEAEEKKNGLIIIKALYGKLQASDDGELMDGQCIDVTVQLQALVKDSKLIIPDTSSKSGLPGFYDPCIEEEKSLYIRYKFRTRLHQVTLSDKELIRLPQQRHSMKTETLVTNKNDLRISESAGAGDGLVKSDGLIKSALPPTSSLSQSDKVSAPPAGNS